MDWLTILWTDLIWHDGKFLGMDWGVWKVIGWLGNAVFFSRFFVQWYATEKKKQVVVPHGVLVVEPDGSLTAAVVYSLHQQDSVFIFAYAFTWIPYTRNLIIHYAPQEGAHELSGLREELSAAVEFLSELRREAGGGLLLRRGSCG